MGFGELLGYTEFSFGEGYGGFIWSFIAGLIWFGL